MRSLFPTLTASGLISAALSAANAAAPAVPDFSGYWVRPEAGSDRIFYPAEKGPGPVVNTDASGTFMIGDYASPILKPGAAAAVKKHGDAGRAGQVIYPPWSVCWPVGVPLILNMAEAVQFLQTPSEVTIIYQRDHRIRHIYLNVPHSANPKPNWTGESVGHYEGDTLVVDTIAQDTRTEVDRFGTPHSAALHVVERYRLASDRKRIEISFAVEDPVTFTAPWSAKVAYVPLTARRGASPSDARFEEIACAENNRDMPIPVAAGADF